MLVDAAVADPCFAKDPSSSNPAALQVAPGDTVVLGSDGLWGTLILPKALLKPCGPAGGAG